MIGVGGIEIVMIVKVEAIEVKKNIAIAQRLRVNRSEFAGGGESPYTSLRIGVYYIAEDGDAVCGLTHPGKSIGGGMRCNSDG